MAVIYAELLPFVVVLGGWANTFPNTTFLSLGHKANSNTKKPISRQTEDEKKLYKFYCIL